MHLTQSLQKYGLFREGSNLNQIICAVLINMPVFAYGASMGWMSPMALLLQSTHSPRGVPLTDEEVSWVASIAYLSGAFANFFLAILGDKIGRKKTLIFVSFTSTITWILMLSSMNIWVMVTARMFVGISMAGSYVTCPVYTKEISSAKIRGTLGCLPMALHTSGNLFLYVIGDILEYRTVLWICLGIPMLHAALFTMMPESPSYLVKKGKIEEATQAIMWLRCKTVNDFSVQEEINRIMTEQSNDEQTKLTGMKAIRGDKVLSKSFNMAMVVVLARDLCGVITFLNFAGEIFSISSEGTGIVLTPNQQAMLLGGVSVLASIIATSTIEKAGRKVLFCGTAGLSGISMILLASWFLVKEFGIVLTSWIPVITLCICVFCDSAGMLPASSVLVNELFSFKYRSIVLAITLTVADIIDFIQVILFKPICKYIGVYLVFYLFSFFCLASALYIVIVLPQTKGRTLEDIYRDLAGKDNVDDDLRLQTFKQIDEIKHKD